MYYGSDPNVHTTFTGDATLVTAAAQQATAKVDEFKDKAEQGNASAVDGFKKSVGAVTSFIAKMTAAVGIATSFFAIGQQVRQVWTEFFETGTEKAKKFVETLGADPSTNLKKTTEEIQRLQARLAANSESTVGNVVNYLTGSSTAQLEEQIAVLEGSARSNAQQIRAQEDRKREDIAKTEEIRQRKEAETQQVEALNQERADDERDAKLRAFAEDQQREGLERARALGKELEEASRKAGEAFASAIQVPIDKLQQLNDQFTRQQGASFSGTQNLAQILSLGTNAPREEGWGMPP